MDRQVAAVSENFRQLPGNGAASRRNTGRYVLRRHGRSGSGIDVTSYQCATSGFNDLVVFFGQLTLARG